MSSKRYYVPGMDSINQMVETPVSKEKTDKKRFIITTAVAAVAAALALISTVFSVLSYLQGTI